MCREMCDRFSKETVPDFRSPNFSFVIICKTQLVKRFSRSFASTDRLWQTNVFHLPFKNHPQFLASLKIARRWQSSQQQLSFLSVLWFESIVLITNYFECVTYNGCSFTARQVCLFESSDDCTWRCSRSWLQWVQGTQVSKISVLSGSTGLHVWTLSVWHFYYNISNFEIRVWFVFNIVF